MAKASTHGVAPSTLPAALSQLLKDHSGLGVRLQEVPFSWSTGIHRLSGQFYYLSFADGVPSVKEFVEYLYDCLIPYCLPKSKLAAVLSSADIASDYSRIVRLGDEARGLFINAKNQLESGGEPGEVILYALLEWALKAPRLVSKMYLKTNNNMPVHGTDGIHLGYDATKDDLVVYFGESKIYHDFAAAAAAAFKSINELLANTGQISREIEILSNLSDLSVLPDAFQKKIKEYIDPYSHSPLTLKKRVVHACLLGFEYSVYKRILKLPPSQVAASFETRYRKRVASACRVVERHYANQIPTTANLHLFLLPFPSLSDFRTQFYSKIGIQP